MFKGRISLFAIYICCFWLSPGIAVGQPAAYRSCLVTLPHGTGELFSFENTIKIMPQVAEREFLKAHSDVVQHLNRMLAGGFSKFRVKPVSETEFYSCFPQLRGILTISERAATRRDEERRQAEEKQLRADEERAKPESRLRELYDNYARVRTCFEARKGFAVVYVNEVKMADVREAARVKEQKLMTRFPNLPSNKIWEEVSKGAESFFKLLSLEPNRINDALQQSCNLAVAWMLSSADGYDSPVTKKDF